MPPFSSKSSAKPICFLCRNINAIRLRVLPGLFSFLFFFSQNLDLATFGVYTQILPSPYAYGGSPFRSFSWFLPPEKRKGTKRKKTVGVNFPPYSVLRLPKSTATFFKISSQRNFKIVTFVLCEWVEILNSCYPLTRPTTTVGFSKQPKG